MGASCRCFTVGFSEGYPKESGYELGLAEIRTRWCKEHNDLDRFGPPERNTLRLVWWFVFSLVLFHVLEGPCSPLYNSREQGYMESSSRVRLESYSEWVG